MLEGAEKDRGRTPKTVSGRGQLETDRITGSFWLDPASGALVIY
jgi:hypothetical protein